VISFTSGSVAVTVAVDEDPASSFALSIETSALQIGSGQAFAESPPEVTSLRLPAVRVNGELVDASANGDSTFVTAGTPTIDPFMHQPGELHHSLGRRGAVSQRPSDDAGTRGAGRSGLHLRRRGGRGVAAMVFDGKTLELRPLQAAQPAMVIVAARVFGDLDTREVQWLLFGGATAAPAP
jgi:hypothetical protein